MRNPLVFGVGIALLLATVGDHYTTWMCLRAPVAGWEITEINPIAAYLFQVFGLVPGLLIDSFLTVIAVTCVYRTDAFTDKLKIGGGLAATALTVYAVVNNVKAMFALGIL
jgi:hypothetical protein